ncbi:MAG: AMP-binding protein [Christensenellaceae bacterium]|jgi:long-chain acyl-CoA synthetase
MVFFDELEKHGNMPALILEDGRHISYHELLQSADRVAKEVPARSVVFLVCKNACMSVCGYVGLLRKKAVPVLVNGAVDSKLYEALIKQYRPSYILLPKEQKEEYGRGQAVLEQDGYLLMRTSLADDYGVHDDLALLLTTSGSTGSPKLVRQSYKNIEANTKSIVEYLGIRQDDRAISTMPMSYTYGLSIINSHLYAGAAIILTDRTLMDKAFWALFKEHGATTFGGVPYIYEMLKKLRFERMDLPSLRYLTQAGGKLSKELSLEFADMLAKRGVGFVVMYGQTEATARMSYLPAEYAVEKAGSMGIAIPGGEFMLIDTDGSPITEAGKEGELVYKGDNVTLGYAESCDDLIKGDENGGVLVTGDIAKRDEDGFYYITGRKKRFLKMYGNRINLDELERILKAEGYECALCGQDDHMAIFVTREEDAQAAHACASKKTGIHPSGFSVRYIPELPRSEAGKVLYSELEKLCDV